MCENLSEMYFCQSMGKFILTEWKLSLSLFIYIYTYICFFERYIYI